MDLWLCLYGTGTYIWGDLVFYLCLETFIRNKQCLEAVWDPALSLSSFILHVFVIYLPRHYMAGKKVSTPAHSCCVMA